MNRSCLTTIEELPKNTHLPVGFIFNPAHDVSDNDVLDDNGFISEQGLVSSHSRSHILPSGKIQCRF